ncbi:hypothetical protein [Microbacterium arborescens]|uniref:hypothetical protein n=1 Tax=Microbacterium arborescens TaxID=33883 RepID=UPI0012EDEFD1|nr:hypothetical protein [Microbacterium arborescens]
MRRRRGPDEVRALLHRRRDLLEAGESERSIERSVRDGVRVHVRRGWYVDRAAFDELYTEDAHLLHVMAVAHEVRGHAAVSHESAAVLHGLDLYRVRPTRVHLTTAPGARVSSSPDAFRHCTPLDAHDVVEVNGIRCTSLARTVFDVARTMTPEAALVMADRAERIWCDGTGRSSDEWRTAMAARVAAAGAARGIRRARWVTGFADGRAESTLESVSRFRLHQLGFRSVRLQVPIAGPRGAGWYRVDFGLDDADAWGECDGVGKYLDPELRSAGSAERTVLDEKRREDWIRGTTGRRLVRWEARHVISPSAFAAHLRAFNIHPPL